MRTTTYKQSFQTQLHPLLYVLREVLSPSFFSTWSPTLTFPFPPLVPSPSPSLLGQSRSCTCHPQRISCLYPQPMPITPTPNYYGGQLSTLDGSRNQAQEARCGRGQIRRAARSQATQVWISYLRQWSPQCNTERTRNCYVSVSLNGVP